MGKTKNNAALNYVKLFAITTGAALAAAGLLLLISAFVLDKFRLSAEQFRYIIYGVYLITGLTTGLVGGKCQREKKFIWGALAGTLWFILVLVLSMCMNKNGIDAGELFPAAVCMIGGGMLGGMLA